MSCTLVKLFLGWSLLSLSITPRLATSFVGVALKKCYSKKKKETIIADSLVQEDISCHQNWVWIQPQATFVFVSTSFSLKGQIYSEKKEIELELVAELIREPVLIIIQKYSDRIVLMA